MHRYTPATILTLMGLGLGLTGCSEPNKGGSASESDSDSAGGTSTDAGGGGTANITSQPATGPTTGVSGNSESATMGANTDSETTADPATGGSSAGPDTDTSAAIDTSTTGDETTSTGDDTSAGTTADEPAEECLAPAMMIPCDDGEDPFKALGLGCSDDATVAIPIKNPVMMAPDKSSYRAAKRFGSAMDPMDPLLPAWGPKEGQRFLVIGTGKFPVLQPDGALVENDNQDSEGNGNPDELSQLPGVMKYQKGSNNGQGGAPFMNCDGKHDCSDTLEGQWNIEPNNVANDVFYMAFDLTVPQGTHGYLFDFVFFSEEYPDYIGTTFNDMFVVWSTSETFTGNVTFINDQPLTVTALADDITIKPGDPRLAGTGFPGDEEGGATEWFTAKASAAPGETFTVAISIFDMGDAVWDTVGILDNFRWDCQGCVPSEVNDCGVAPQ